MDETNGGNVQISGGDKHHKVNDFQGEPENTATDIENQSEKYDTSPENLEKSSCDITPNDDLSTSISGMTTTATTNNETNSSISNADCVNRHNEDKTAAKNKSTGFAFTIDFNEGKTVDNRKYKEIAERFQHRQQQQQEQRRHRRGVSLSKLDDSRKSSTSLNNMENSRISADDSSVPATVATKPPFKQRTRPDDTKSDEKCDTRVVLRRPRPTTAQTQNFKDSSKRHSWSPRSSLNYEKIPQMPQDSNPKDQSNKCVNSTNAGGFQPKSTILQRALENNSLRPSSKSNAKPKTSIANVAKNISKDHVITAPLEYVRPSDDEGSIGEASQATYTLDGDNYTEEEKERMSIDRLGKKNFDMSIDSRSRNELNKAYGPTLRNALQMNYSRDIKTEPKINQMNAIERGQMSVSSTKASPKSAKSYLDKIKTRVKTIGDRTFHKKPSTNEKLMNLQVVRTDDSSPVDADHGVFTSITACGVLNKQHHDNNMTANFATNNRKPSLTKFQIDSSEYIQPKVDESLMSSYTDYEKAKQNEYKLKIFSTIDSYTSSGTSPAHTDDDNLSVECVDDRPISIKTAPTKNDWIQEWAKNARRRNNLLASSASASPKLQHHSKMDPNRAKAPHLQGKDDDRMSQSYDTYFSQSEQFGDDAIENSSDEYTAHTSRPVGCGKANEIGEQKLAANVLRPPLSPTKIPSPMHTQMRVRSSSANRSFRNTNTVCFFNEFLLVILKFKIFNSECKARLTQLP